MSYLEVYRTRLAKRFQIKKEALAKILCEGQRAVDHDRVMAGFLSEYDLKSRGLTPVIRTLYDRISSSLEVKRTKSLGVKSTLIKKSGSSSEDLYLKEIVAVLNDSHEKAVVMTCAYLECIELLDGPKAGWVEVMRQVGFFLLLALADELEEFLKYQTASLCALAMSNVVDVAPECVLRGHWRVGEAFPYCLRVTAYLRKLCIQRRTPKGVQLAFSIYTTKRVAPALSSSFVDKAMKKNLKALTEERNLPDVIRHREAVIRTVRELHFLAMNPVTDNQDVPVSAAELRNKEIRGKKLFCDLEHQKIPSLSACYENTRGKGGSLEYLLGKTALKKPVGQEGAHVGYVRDPRNPDKIVEVRGALDPDEMERLMRPSLDGMGRRVMVRREPILEPFKVRIISKGEAEPYQRAQNFQPFLWSLLQLAPCFQLTGRPLCDEDMTQMALWARTKKLWCMFVSGDYKAATDNLHQYLCGEALREVCHLWKIPYEEALNMLSCLINHRIDDRDQGTFKVDKLTGRVSEEGGEDYSVVMDGVHDQVWGQLMGSPISFPILCIINAAITRMVMEDAFGCFISLSEGAFNVNGDDVAFPLPPAEYQHWCKQVTLAGLEPSVGKNYVSRRYCVINSKLFDFGDEWDYSETVPEAKNIPLVSMNLVYCQQHESTERRKDEALVIGESLRHGKTLEGRMTELIHGFGEDMREKLLKRAYTHAKPILALLPPVSWVLPKCLGGLGLPATKDHIVADHHLKIASMILCLDDETRKNVVRLQWLREPGNTFCEYTNNQIRRLNEELGLKTVLLPYKVEDNIYSSLIKSNIGYGASAVLLNTKNVLRTWKRMYSRWVARAQKIKWTVSRDHKVKGLHAMSQEKALTYKGLFWTWEESVEWVDMWTASTLLPEIKLGSKGGKCSVSRLILPG